MGAAPPPLSVAGLPEGLEEILLRCLAKDPDDRPASAAELRDLLASLEDLRPWRLEDAQRWWSSRSRAPSERATSRRRAALAETVPEASLSIDLASRFPPR